MPVNDALPEIPEKFRDRVLTRDPNALLPAVDSQIIAAAAPEDKVVAIKVAGFEIAALYADKTGPYAFAQLLLERFKAAGAPVEGTIRLRLARGKVFKLKSNPGDASFRYVWLPPEHCQSLGVQGHEGSLVN
jgi:hypothetical protein